MRVRLYENVDTSKPFTIGMDPDLLRQLVPVACTAYEEDDYVDPANVKARILANNLWLAAPHLYVLLSDLTNTTSQ